MVLGIIGLLTLTAIPTTIGIAQGVTHKDDAKNKELDAKRMAKFYIDVYCDAKSSRTKHLHGQRLVLRDGCVWIDEPKLELRSLSSYTLKAFYIEYPDEDRFPPELGLVSQISDSPPMMNWIYIDSDTLELKHGNRSASRPHLVGPWDWTEDDDQLGVTFEEWEGFVAVQRPDHGGEWQVFFDRADDGLEGIVPRNWRRLKISLERVLVGEEDVEEVVQGREEKKNKEREGEGEGA